MHSWSLTPKRAIELPKRLAGQVRIDLELNNLRNVTGVDVSYSPKTTQSVATVVVLSYPDLETIRMVVAKMKTPFPYISGLLSFRKTPISFSWMGMEEPIHDV